MLRLQKRVGFMSLLTVFVKGALSSAANRKCEISAELSAGLSMPLKTVEFLVSVQGSDVEASETWIYELIDSLSERGG